MKKRTKKLNPHNTKQKDRSAAAWLLAIFCLLLVWFLLWLYDWYDELFGLNKKASKNTTSSTAVNSEGDTNGVTNYSTIEYQPIQHITQQLGSYGYVHKQAGASTVWTINHPFGYVPTVSLFNLQGEEIYGEVTAPIIENWIEEYEEYQRVVETVTITFAEPEAGFAVFS